MGDLSEHFSRAEFACRDGCGFDTVSMDLVERLERMRAFLLGEPIIIVSGCRCPKHNAEVGGLANGAHLTGEAADLRPNGPWNSSARFCWMEAAGAAGFRRIGISPTKFHVDVSQALPRPSLWLYPK